MANAHPSQLRLAPLAASLEAFPAPCRQPSRPPLRLVADCPPAPAAAAGDPRLGAAVCLGFCGLFWSAVALAVIWS